MMPASLHPFEISINPENQDSAKRALRQNK
jgi:hypothetical protein